VTNQENLRYYRITDKNIQFLGRDIGLEALQSAVGGYIESIPKPSDATFRVAYANEEGLIRNLELNRTASGMVGRTIVGPMVIGVAEGE
jgi:hypothetical protein